MTEEVKNTEVTEETKGEKAAGSEDTGSEGAKTKTEEEIREEIRKEFEAVTDKRVTEAVKKVEKKYKDQAAKEKMTAEERAKAEEKERLEAQAKKDLDLTIKGLKLDVVDAISELGLDSGFRNLIAVEDLAAISDEDERKKALTNRVKNMKALFDAEVNKRVEKAKAEFLKGSTPPTGSKADGKNNSDYDTAKKDGNVRGMISAKMAKYRNPDEDN